MTAAEFNKTAIRTEDAIQITFDVRPFGDRQSEAVGFYLHEVGTAIGYGTLSIVKPIVLLYCPGTVFLLTTQPWLKSLASKGVPINLQEADC
jgi:hypothetical protein